MSLAILPGDAGDAGDACACDTGDAADAAAILPCRTNMIYHVAAILLLFAI